jgi:tetratricopeptide (TPR) repeat protein
MLEIARVGKDHQQERSILSKIAIAYVRLNDMHKAIEYYEQALEIAREIKDHAHERAIISKIGMAYEKMGEIFKAVEYFNQALAVARGIGDQTICKVLLLSLNRPW